MKAKQPLPLQAVNNIFNTHADLGIGPLNKEEIRARLISGLFFVDTLLVPGTSLLCNPVTSFMLHNDPEFLDNLLKTKKITPILTDSAQSFSALLDQLVDRRTVALKGRPMRELTKIASFLDPYLESMDGGLKISQAALDKAKTETSKCFIDNLKSILPMIKPHYRQIVKLFDQELENQQIVSGSWWHKLSKNNRMEGVRACSDQLGEIGTMVFDFPYTKLVSCPLTGHSYKQGIEGIGNITQSFLPSVEVYASPGILDPRDIDALFFDKKILTKIDLKNYEILDKSTRKKRSRYIKAMKELLSQPSIDLLLETKTRLDEYLISLSSVIKSTELVKYAVESKKIGRISSRLKLLQCFDKVVLTLVATVPPAIGRSFTDDIFELAIITGVAKLAEQALKEISSKKLAELEDTLKKEIASREQIRPISLQLNTD